MQDQGKNELAAALVKMTESMGTDRTNFEYVWQQISEFVLPNRGDFLFQRAKGSRADQRVFDTTAVQANLMLASALHSGLINPGSTWFSLATEQPLEFNSYGVRRWLEDAQRIMMKTFNSDSSNFYQQAHELLLDLVAYGTACMYVDEQPGEDVRFSTRHLSEIHINENNKGVVDKVIREFEFTARQAAQEWGEENLPDALRVSLTTEPNKAFKFLHIVMPRKDAERMGAAATEGVPNNRDFIGIYVCKEEKCVMNVAGFYENPYIVVRWEKLVGEAYGRSPAWNALSDIRMINVMSEVMIRAAQKQVDPPLLVADDGVIMPLHTRPGGTNVGGVSMDGRPLIQPLQTGGNLNIGIEMMDQRRDAIRQAYFVDRFIPKEGTPVSATEFAQNEENGMRLSGPQPARVQTEFLSKIIDRLFAILMRAGGFPEVPEELEGQDLKIEYTNPLSKNQRARELLALNRALQSVGPLIEIDPDLTDVVDGESMFRDALEISGVRIKNIRSEEEYAEIRDAKAEAAEQQQQMAQAQELAGTAGDLKKAGIEL